MVEADYKIVETAGALSRHKALLERTVDVKMQSIPGPTSPRTLAS